MKAANRSYVQFLIDCSPPVHKSEDSDNNTRSELVSVVLGASEYAYDFDSIGNRLSSTEAGTALAYSANALNQYVSMGERSGRSDTLVASAVQSENQNDFSSQSDVPAPQGVTAQSASSSEATGVSLLPFSPEYDADGNMTLIQTSTGTWSVSYNAENRPTRFENTETGTIVECAYDFKGRRFEKKVTREGSVILHHRYVYDGYLQIAALDLTRSNAPALWLVLWDPSQPTATRPLALQRYGKWFTYGWDLTKNVTELFGSDSGIKTSYTYDPFGNVSVNGATSQDLLWSSEHCDSELALVYYNFRHYSPDLGRFLSRDPIEEQGGLNLYTLVSNAPLSRIDYLGRDVLARCNELVENAKSTEIFKKYSEKLDDTFFCSIPKISCKCCKNNGRTTIAFYVPRYWLIRGNTITVCANRLENKDQGYINEIMAHEMLHAVQSCFDKKLKTPCETRICREIEAYSKHNPELGPFIDERNKRIEIWRGVMDSISNGVCYGVPESERRKIFERLYDSCLRKDR